MSFSSDNTSAQLNMGDVQKTHDTADRAAIEAAQNILYAEGTKLRQEIFGPEYISQSKQLSDFEQPAQMMAVATGWSLCWTRSGLERKTRSLLCLVMLAVLGRDHELSVHVRGAVSNGCTVEEIREALLQVRVDISYCLAIFSIIKVLTTCLETGCNLCWSAMFSQRNTSCEPRIKRNGIAIKYMM